jgi:hypothetical protein
MTERRPRRSGESGGGRSSANGSHRSSDDGGGSGRPVKASTPSPAALAKRVSAELGELLGRTPEGVVSLERTENGWRFGIEVVEMRRVPETADVIGEYEVDADRRGRLVSYHRARRYARGQVRDDR